MSREIDKEIAEKVMGLTVKPIRVINHRGITDDIGTTSEPYRMSDGRMGVQAHALPHYSTDIAAAWQVVEKMREKGFVLALDNRSPFDDTPWWAEFATTDYQRGVQRFSATAALAICNAALAAIASETPEVRRG